MIKLGSSIETAFWKNEKEISSFSKWSFWKYVGIDLVDSTKPSFAKIEVTAVYELARINDCLCVHVQRLPGSCWHTVSRLTRIAASDRMLRWQSRCGHASGNYVDIASARSSGRLRFRAKFTPRSFVIADYLNFVRSSVPLDKLSKDNPRLSSIISGNSQHVTLWLNLKTYDFRQRFQVKLRKVLISIYFFIESEF